MQAVNKKMDPQKTLKTMQDFQKENMKMGMTEDMSKNTMHLAKQVLGRYMGIVWEVMCAAKYAAKAKYVCGMFFRRNWGLFLFFFFVCSSRLALKSKLVTGNQFDWLFCPYLLPSCLTICSVNDTLDEIFEESGDEEESQDIVNQVLDEIGIEISGKVRNSKREHDKPHLSYIPQLYRHHNSA